VSTVAPPAANPWDVAEVTSRALAVLRLDPADADAERVAEAAAEACVLADELLDKVTPYATSTAIPAPAVGAVVDGAVELYRRKDAPNGVTDSWTADGSYMRFSSDPTKGMRGKLRPFRERRGVA
jgi:hypothetical protein